MTKGMGLPRRSGGFKVSFCFTGETKWFNIFLFRCQQSGIVGEGWRQEGWSGWDPPVHQGGQNWDLNLKIWCMGLSSVAIFWHLNQCIYCKVYCILLYMQPQKQWLDKAPVRFKATQHWLFSYIWSLFSFIRIIHNHSYYPTTTLQYIMCIKLLNILF